MIGKYLVERRVEGKAQCIMHFLGRYICYGGRDFYFKTY